MSAPIFTFLQSAGGTCADALLSLCHDSQSAASSPVFKRNTSAYFESDDDIYLCIEIRILRLNYTAASSFVGGSLVDL